MIRQRVREIFAGQMDVDVRLPFVRVSVAAACLITVVNMPRARALDAVSDTLLQPPLRPVGTLRLSTVKYTALRLTTITLLTLWGLGVRHPAIGYGAATGFAALNGYIAHILPQIWNFNTHLNALLIACAAVDSSGRPSTTFPGRRSHARRGAVLAVMQFATALIYSQAGLSKLLHGGRSWLGDGEVVRVSLAVLGTPAGKRLFHRPTLTKLLGRLVLIGEICFLPALVALWPFRWLLAIGAAGFHLLTAVYLRINFWHLWALYPALFLPLLKKRVKQWDLHPRPHQTNRTQR